MLSAARCLVSPLPERIETVERSRKVNRPSWRISIRPSCLSHPPSPRGKPAVRSERSGRDGCLSLGGVDVSWLPLPVQASSFAPNPFGAKPRRGQGVRVSMLSFFRLPISKENLWKAEDQCTEPTSGTTPSVFLNTTTLTTNRNQGRRLVTATMGRDTIVLRPSWDVIACTRAEKAISSPS